MMSGADKVILPVWHEVDHDHVARYSPPLADKLAAQSGEGVPAIVEHIERVLSRDGRGGGSESVGRPATPPRDGGESAAPVTGAPQYFGAMGRPSGGMGGSRDGYVR